MFHLAAYYNSALANVADTDISALADGIVTIQNNHIIPQTPIQLRAMWARSTALLRVKIRTPKLNQISPVYIRPIGSGGIVPEANPNLDIRFYTPLQLQQLEEIQVLATSSTGTSEKFTALLWMFSTFTPAPLGDVYPLRWTSTVAAVANAWTGIAPLTWEQQLPYGMYAVIGSEHFSTNAIGHRWTFDQQYERPGTLSFATNNLRLPYNSERGELGLWGTFHTTNLPRPEVLCNVADNSHEGYLYCVKIG